MKQALANPAIRRILAAAAVSQIGDWAARLAVAFVVLDETGLASGVSVVAVLFFLPWLGPGQLLASFGDRMPRVRLLVGSELTRAALYAAIALAASTGAPVWILLTGVALVAVIDPVWEANRSALLVDVASDDEYAPAQKFVTSVNQASTLVGWALGGVLVAAVGTVGTLWFNAGSFVVSAMFVGGISVPKDSERPHRSGSLRAAVRFLRSDRVSLIAIVTTVGLTIPGMGIETQAPVFGREAGLADQWIGVLAAMVPAVTLLGVLLIPHRRPDAQLLSMSFGVSAVALVGAAVAFSFRSVAILAFVGYAAVGVPFAASTAANIVVGRRLPGSDRASVFVVVQTAVFAALSIGAIVGGPISDLAGSVFANISLAIVGAVICGVGGILTFSHGNLAPSERVVSNFTRNRKSPFHD
ncbi:MAG: MFS transporter [Acidimicrobiales bacterium]|nr:MFS transporter [Acidimicrobiales bacterium]